MLLISKRRGGLSDVANFCRITGRGYRGKQTPHHPSFRSLEEVQLGCRQEKLPGWARPGKTPNVVGGETKRQHQRVQPGTRQNLQGKLLTSTGHQDQEEAQKLN